MTEASCLPDAKFGALGLSLLQDSQVSCENRGNPLRLTEKETEAQGDEPPPAVLTGGKASWSLVLEVNTGHL